MARFENVNVNKINGGKPIFILKGDNYRATNTTVAAVVHSPLTIPAGTLVLGVHTTVITAANTTCTATVGDGDGATSWDASVNLTASANTRVASVPGTDAYATIGKYYANGDTIDYAITMSTANDVAVIRCDAVCCKL